MQNSDMLFLQLKENVPSDALLPLKESLSKADESVVQKFLLVNFKNAFLGIIFSVILPGVDRIYKGDIVLGIVKIIYFLAIYIGIGSGISENKAIQENIAIGVAWLFALLLMLVWFFVDIFLVYKNIKKDNLKKIFEILEEKNG